MRWAVMILALGMAGPTSAQQVLPNYMPEQTEIDPGYSNVSCPSQAAAKTLLENYYKVPPAPKDSMRDIDLFFKGLEATGCSQDGAQLNDVIRIQKVEQRIAITTRDEQERFIRYVGVRASGAVVNGIVSEDGNNAMPRTEIAKWRDNRGSDGWLDLRQNEGNFVYYRCDTVDQARKIVVALQKIEGAKTSLFERKAAQLAKEQGCRMATDRYFPIAKFEEASHDCGFECVINPVALEAYDRSGKTIGLVYDASLI